MSRLLGEKREEDAKRVGVFSIYGSLGIALVYSLICLMFTEPLVRLLGASDNTIGYASGYLFWAVVIGAIPTVIIMNHFVGLYGVVSAQLISDCITFIFSTLIYRSVYNKLQSGLGDADKLLSDY